MIRILLLLLLLVLIFIFLRKEYLNNIPSCADVYKTPGAFRVDNKCYVCEAPYARGSNPDVNAIESCELYDGCSTYNTPNTPGELIFDESGECYTCPTNYNKNPQMSANSDQACVLPFSKCAAGTFPILSSSRDGCYICPEGYVSSKISYDPDQACITTSSKHPAMFDGVGTGYFCDEYGADSRFIYSDNQSNGVSGCYSCPTNTRMSALTTNPNTACEVLPSIPGYSTPGILSNEFYSKSHHVGPLYKKATYIGDID